MEQELGVGRWSLPFCHCCESTQMGVLMIAEGPAKSTWQSLEIFSWYLVGKMVRDALVGKEGWGLFAFVINLH